MLTINFSIKKIPVILVPFVLKTQRFVCIKYCSIQQLHKKVNKRNQISFFEEALQKPYIDHDHSLDNVNKFIYRILVIIHRGVRLLSNIPYYSDPWDHFMLRP